MRRHTKLLVLMIAVLSGPHFAKAQRGSPKSKSNSEPKWEEFFYPDDGFAITLPERPESYKSTQVPGGMAYKLILPQHPGNLWVILHVGTAPASCENVLNRYRDAVKRSQADDGASKKPAVVREVKIDGHIAIESEADSFPNGEKYTGYEHFQCVDKRLYIFTASFPADSPRTDLNRILNSFRFVRK